MSMNVFLEWRVTDKHGKRRSIEVPLRQTPTDASYEIVGRNESYEAVKERYLKWYKEACCNPRRVKGKVSEWEKRTAEEHYQEHVDEIESFEPLRDAGWNPHWGVS